MSNGNKVKTTFTLSEPTINKINELSEKWGVSKTRVVERLVSIAPREYPEKKVAVLSINPIICTTNEGWDWGEKYTGELYIEFYPSESIRQIIVTVKDLSFDVFTQWLEDEYPKMKRMLP